MDSPSEPGQTVVQQVHGLVRAHGQRLADRLRGPLRSHGQDGDLGLVTRGTLRLGDLQALLDGVLVKLVDESVHRRAVQGTVRLELALGPGIGHLLDTHDDVHGLHRPPSLLGYSLPNWLMLDRTGSIPAMLLAGSSSPGPPGGRRARTRGSFKSYQLFNYLSHCSGTGQVPPPARRRLEALGRQYRFRAHSREEWPFASGHRHRDRIPRAYPCRLPGGPRPRGAGDRRRRDQDRQGRPRRGPVLRTRPGTAAAKEPRSQARGSPCRSPRSARSAISISCVWARPRARAARLTSAPSTARPRRSPRTWPRRAWSWGSRLSRSARPGG